MGLARSTYCGEPARQPIAEGLSAGAADAHGRSARGGATVPPTLRLKARITAMSYRKCFFAARRCCIATVQERDFDRLH
jgi:hypothetical protein